MIDVLIVVSMVCVFFFVALLLQKWLVAPVPLDRATLVRLMGPLFLLLHASYLVLARVFLGSSLGEWACGLRLGEPRQRFSPRYVFLVLLRFTVVVATGVVILPILSLLSGVDWAGRLSGVPLISVQRPSARPK